MITALSAMIVFMANRARDWFSQAERNLEQARASRRDGRHEWACFAAQQSEEAIRYAGEILEFVRHQMAE